MASGAKIITDGAATVNLANHGDDAQSSSHPVTDSKGIPRVGVRDDPWEFVWCENCNRRHIYYSQLGQCMWCGMRICDSCWAGQICVRCLDSELMESCMDA